MVRAKSAAVWGGFMAIHALTLALFSNGLVIGCRRHPPRGSCVHNQKQIVLAAKMYADDHGGVFPNVGRYTGARVKFAGKWTEGRFWGDVIRKYVKHPKEVYRCPSVRKQPSPSYAWNRHLSDYPEKLIEYPTATPLCWDWVSGQPTAPGIPLNPPPYDTANWESAWDFYPGMSTPSRKEMAAACSRHAGGLVLGFADGHAKFERPVEERFQRCEDRPMPGFPTGADAGIKLSMYPQDPVRE